MKTVIYPTHSEDPSRCLGTEIPKLPTPKGKSQTGLKCHEKSLLRMELEEESFQLSTTIWSNPLLGNACGI